jgi:hypothetical protein
VFALGALFGLRHRQARPVIDLWPDVGEILGISRQSTYNAAYRGEIPTIRIGRRLVVPGCQAASHARS